MICPPTISEARNSDSAAGPSSLWRITIWRSVSPTIVATANIDGAARIEGWRSSGALVRSSSRLTTACVVARLPADIRVITRSPGTCQLRILRTCEISSTPALVRVSDMNTSPLFKRMPTQ